MELIGLTGAKGSGKNTAFLGIEQWSRGRGLHAAERGFADKLKWSACRIFNPDATQEEGVRWANEIKNETILRLDWLPKYGGGHSEVTGREFLQHYGTESHRDLFGEDFWVDQLLPMPMWGAEGESWQENFREGDIRPDFAVITDLRFENEAERVKDLGGAIWEIQRPELETSDSHASETPLPRNMIDKVIVNSGTIEDLLVMIESAMDGEYHLKFLTQDPA